jgi:hypothetical protein
MHMAVGDGRGDAGQEDYGRSGGSADPLAFGGSCRHGSPGLARFRLASMA